MVQSLRAEIGKLQRVLDLLLDRPGEAAAARRTSAPEVSGDRAISSNPQQAAPKKRVMSPEGKARIAAAQKKRWAKQQDRAPGRSATRTQTASTKRSNKTVPPKPARNLASARAKKSTAAGKRTATTQAKTQTASPKRTAVTEKKSARKTMAAKTEKKATTKRSAKEAATVQGAE